MQYVNLIFLILAILYLIFIICKDIVTIRDINNTFTCEYCNTLNKDLSNGHSCTECGKVFKNIIKSWDHMMGFKTSKINTKIKRLVYHHKDFVKIPKLELIISIILLIILLIALVIRLVY